MGRSVRYASNPGDESGISLLDAAASSCAAEAAAEVVRACASGDGCLDLDVGDASAEERNPVRT